MPNCDGCGFIYEEIFNYCPQCGRQKPEIIKNINNTDVSGFSCPIDHSIDQVQKVTEIIREGTRKVYGSVPISHNYSDNRGKTHSYTSFEDYSATETTNLAEELKPPRKPSPPGKHGCGIWFLLIILISSFLGICPSISGMIIFSAIDFPYYIYDTPLVNKDMDIGLLILLIIISIIVLILFGFLLHLWIKAIKRQEVEYPLKYTKYEEELEKWKVASSNWELLYYCRRHGIVFIPGTNTHAPIYHMTDYIYERYEPNSHPIPTLQ